MATNNGEEGLFPKTKIAPTVWSKKTLNQKGLYRFTVAVSGENVKYASLEIWVDWQCYWNNFDVGTSGKQVKVTSTEVVPLLDGA